MKELTISLDPQSVTPLYEQIYQYVKEDIQSGRLACGVKLPSSRSLARYLEISRSTVELAYEQLLSEGYIETKPRKGVFVAQIDGVYQFRREEQPGTERQEEQREKYRYDFSPSGIDLKSFPAKSFWMIVQRPFALEIRRVSMGCAVRSAVICIRREESGAARNRSLSGRGMITF